MLHRNEVTDVPTALSTAIREQRCIHAVTGRAPESKLCGNGFACGSCEYDQMLEDTGMTTATVKIPRCAYKAA
jgi:hypothetical protein